MREQNLKNLGFEPQGKGPICKGFSMVGGPAFEL
jgi:hypothetical protein